MDNSKYYYQNLFYNSSGIELNKIWDNSKADKNYSNNVLIITSQIVSTPKLEDSSDKK